ncbi:hypothetical protein M3C17_04270, partial [Microbacterium sp. p3-SID336]|nr:hypothetical protein [Microbacterium sp. p3-SID336]
MSDPQQPTPPPEPTPPSGPATPQPEPAAPQPEPAAPQHQPAAPQHHEPAPEQPAAAPQHLAAEPQYPAAPPHTGFPAGSVHPSGPTASPSATQPPSAYPTAPPSAYPTAAPSAYSPAPGAPYSAATPGSAYPMTPQAAFGSAPAAPRTGNTLGRVAFIVALVTLALDVLLMLVRPFVYMSDQVYTVIGLVEGGFGVVSFIGYAAALILGIIAARRAAPHLLAGIAIGVAGAGLVSLVFAWLSTTFYRFF